MRNIATLTAALEIVEQRLCEPMNAADLADACFLSYSGLQKLFARALNCSVSEYITKRRLSRASYALISSDKSITDIALDYQYGSPEAFSRAFKRFWNVSPIMFRKTRRFAELYPKFKLDGGFGMTKRKPLDVSELYDELKKLGGSYVLGVDLVNFMKTNEKYGYAAGDAVIAAAFARLENELDGDMLLFRTGGDEFAVVTAYKSLPDAEDLARKITAQNGTAVVYGQDEIPLSFRVGIGKIPDKGLNYQKALDMLTESVMQARKTDSYIAVYTP